MIRLCERCFGQISEHEPALHHNVLHYTDHDGASVWASSYTHRNPCAWPRPDAAGWDTRRGIGILRTRAPLSPRDRNS